jgi:hypothetical protein
MLSYQIKNLGPRSADHSAGVAGLGSEPYLMYKLDPTLENVARNGCRAV